MKMNKCFTTVFDPVLKQEGFARKGILYYRRVGHMLQGIKLKPMNPCMINFTSFPYWMYDLRTRQTDIDMAKGYWVEDGGMFVPGADYYFFKDADEDNLQKMENLLALCQQYVLPHLDKMKDEQAYLQLVLKYMEVLLPLESAEDTFIRANERMNIEIMLYNQQFVDPSITAEEYLETWFQNRYQFAISINETQGVMNTLAQYYEKRRDDIAHMRQAGFPALYESMCATMKSRILEHLKLDFE